MDKHLKLFNYISVLYIPLIYVKQIHDNELRKMETCARSDGLYVKIYM
jgi:hypothetical protein